MTFRKENNNSNGNNKANIIIIIIIKKKTRRNRKNESVYSFKCQEKRKKEEKTCNSNKKRNIKYQSYSLVDYDLIHADWAFQWKTLKTIYRKIWYKNKGRIISEKFAFYIFNTHALHYSSTTSYNWWIFIVIVQTKSDRQNWWEQVTYEK